MVSSDICDQFEKKSKKKKKKKRSCQTTEKNLIYLHWTLRKHAYSNILKILQPKQENFEIKNSDIFSYFF